MSETHLPVSAPEDLPPYGADGVDLTLVRWFLTLTPKERLLQCEAWAAEICRVRKYARDE